MVLTRTPLLLLVVPALAASGLGLAACGGDDRAETVRKDAAALTKRGQDLQDATKQAAADVQAGRKTQAEADAELKRTADGIVDDAGDIASDAIDVAKDDARVPDEAKEALEDAQQQLQTP
jgi:outer membrane murein-binding lipoprotein Lpp